MIIEGNKVYWTQLLWIGFVIYGLREIRMEYKRTISGIAFELNYSSPQYLSNQFKQITGFRPSQFRTILEARRSQIDKV